MLVLSPFHRLAALHASLACRLQSATQDWLLGLSARLIFSSALLVFFLNAAATKTGTGFPDFLVPSASAYIQILPSVMEAYGYDETAIPFLPYGLIVYAGTYAEFLLPLMILVGLFTRVVSLAMIGFIAVLSFVDIQFHQVDAATIGALFDRVQDAAILDQRLLWLFPLIYLVLRGPGLLSADAVLGRLFASRRDRVPSDASMRVA